MCLLQVMIMNKQDKQLKGVKIMKFNEAVNMKALPEMPFGKHTITFTGIRWNIDDNDELKGAYIQSKEFREFHIYFFEQNPFSFMDLAVQLGGKEIKDISNAKEQKIIVTRYRNKSAGITYENNFSFNPKFNFERAEERFEASV